MNAVKWARTQWDRVSAWTLIALGGLFVVLGWVGVGREALTAQQIPYIISGGVGGLFLLGVGAMLWLSADLRDEWRRLDAIERNGRAKEEPTAAVHVGPLEPEGDKAPGRTAAASRRRRGTPLASRP